MKGWSALHEFLRNMKIDHGLTNPDIYKLLKNGVKIYKNKILDNGKKLNY